MLHQKLVLSPRLWAVRGLTESTSRQAGRELQSQAHTGAQHSTAPPQELPYSLMHLHSDLPGEGEISPATPRKALGAGGRWED